MSDTQIVLSALSENGVAIGATSEAEVTVAVPGIQGPVGPGVPSGGTTNQVLFKTSNANYDTAWSNVTSAMIGDLEIANADVATNAAIAGTKISPNFGSQNVVTTGTNTAASFIPTGSSVPANGIYLPSANNVAISTNGAGQLFIDANGNVGIGGTTTTGWAQKQVVLDAGSGAAASYVLVNDTTGRTGTDGGLLTLSGSDLYLINRESANLIFRTANTERLRITSDGKLGLGTSAPDDVLDVRSGAAGFSQFVHASGQGGIRIAGTGSASSANLVFSNNHASGIIDEFTIQMDGSTDDLLFISGGTGGTERVRITEEGRVGIGTTSPSGLLHLNASTDSTTFPSIVLQDSGTTSTRLASITNDSGDLNLASTASLSDRRAYISLRDDRTMTFGISNAERARIDSSGRLLVGTSTARANFDNSTNHARLQVEGTDNSTSALGITQNFNGATSGARLILAKSNGSAVGSNTIVAADNILGAVSFQGNDGSEFVQAATIFAAVDGTPSANDMPGRLVFSTTADGASNPTERLRISSSGQVNISGSGSASSPALVVGGDVNTGIYSPGADQVAISTNGTGRLFVDASGNVGINAASTGIISTGIPVIEIKGNSAAQTDRSGGVRFTRYDGVVGAEIYNADGATYIDSKNPYPLIFYTGGGEKMALDSSGRLGLGTSSPGNTLHVVGTGRFNVSGANNAVLASDGGDPFFYAEQAASLKLGTNSAVRMTINSSGSVGIGTTTPSGALHVNAANNAYIYTTTTTNSVSGFVGCYSSTGLDLGTSSNHPITFYQNNLIRATIDTSGRLLVGTSTVANVPFGSQIECSSTSGVAISNLRFSANAFGPTLQLGKSRGASVNSYDLVSSGDTLGQLVWVGADGTDMVSQAASISCQVDGTPGANDMPGRLVFATTADGASSPTERLRITSDGKVGIGSTAPNTKLEIREDSAGSVVELARLNNNAALASGKGARLGFGLSDSSTASPRAYVEAALGAGNKTHLAFGTHTGSGLFERARLDGDGRLLVGTSTSVAAASVTESTLQVSQGAGGVGATLYSLANASGPGGILVLGHGRTTASGLLSANDTVGQVRFAGGDGVDLQSSAAQISAEVDGTPGANDMPGRLVFSTTADGAASPTERMRITSDGKVGIGTTNPTQKLQVTDGVLSNFYIAPGYNGGAGTTIGVGGGEYLAFNGAPFTTERMRIDSSGRLLVGTSSWTGTGNTIYAKLIVTGNTAGVDGNGRIGIARGESSSAMSSGDSVGQLHFSDKDGGEYARIEAYADAAPGASDYPGRLVFSTTADGAASPTERMRITQAGYLKASDNGTYELSTGTYHELRTSIATGPAVLAYGNNGSYSGNVLQLGGSRNTTDGSWNFLKCRHNSIDRLNILDSGNVQNANNSYGAISDIKLKENIVDAGSQWDDLKALQVRNYNFKEGQTHTQIGLIAQEVELVSPGLVSESPDRDEEGNDLGTTTKSVNYSVLYMKAVKALQEAMERIEQLEASNADLLARVTALEAS